MRRLVVLGAIVGFLVMSLVAAAQEGFTVSGRLGATDQEAQEGYFAVDQQTMIVVKPGSELHAYLKGKVGRRVRITVEQASESE